MSHLLGVPWSGGSAQGDLLLSREPARGANRVSRQEKAEAEVTLGLEERGNRSPVWASRPQLRAEEPCYRACAHGTLSHGPCQCRRPRGRARDALPTPSRPPEAAALLHIMEQLLHLLTGAWGPRLPAAPRARVPEQSRRVKWDQHLEPGLGTQLPQGDKLARMCQGHEDPQGW